MANVIRVLATLAFVGVALTACGKRGTLEAPEASDEKPAANSVADSGGKKAKPEDNRTFVLDPLLR